MSKAAIDSTNKTIGIFCGYYLPHLGGVERYVEKLSAELKRRGHKVVIVTSNHRDLPSIETLGGRKVYRLPTYGFAKSRYPLPKLSAEYRRLIRAIGREGIDAYLLNTRFHLTTLIGAEMAKRSGKPILIVEHGTGHFTVNNRLLDFAGGIYEHVLTGWLKRYASRYFGVSKACNKWLKHFSIQASGVFYNAVDVSDAQSAGNDYKGTYGGYTVITYAGRLIKEKGVINLLDAFSAVRKRCPDTTLKLVIAGDGPLLETIRSSYRDASIDVLGRLDYSHMLSLYKQTAIFVHPSLYPEGLPTSILEAGLMGCAVIATAQGGTAEVITDKKHGIITDGSVPDLTEAIVTLVNNPTMRQRYARSLELRIKSAFNWRTVAGNVINEIGNLKTR